MSNWSDDLQKIAKKSGDDLGTVCQAVKISLFSAVVDDTRVDTGRLKGNWQIQDGKKPSGEVVLLDKSGNIVKDKVSKESSQDGLTYFVNNLPYAVVYEEKDAMVGRNVARIKQIVKDEAGKL